MNSNSLIRCANCKPIEWTPVSSEMFSLRRYREWMPYLSQVDSAYWNTELIQD